MYSEFIAIYVGLGVLALLMIATIVLLVVVLRKMNNGTANQRTFNPTQKNVGTNYGSRMGVVFCNNCGTQFDGTVKICPKCGTPR